MKNKKNKHEISSDGKDLLEILDADKKLKLKSELGSVFCKKLNIYTSLGT